MRVLILIFAAVILSGANFANDLKTLEQKVNAGSAKVSDVQTLKDSVATHRATLPNGKEKEDMTELENELQHTLEHLESALKSGRHPDVITQQKGVALEIINRMKLSEEARAK